eukprot:6177978-Pleurochrysis_carterae.AAC.1
MLRPLTRPRYSRVCANARAYSLGGVGLALHWESAKVHTLSHTSSVYAMSSCTASGHPKRSLYPCPLPSPRHTQTALNGHRRLSSANLNKNEIGARERTHNEKEGGKGYAGEEATLRAPATMRGANQESGHRKN